MMAKHLRALLSAKQVSGFCRHFSVLDDVHLSLLAEKKRKLTKVKSSFLSYQLLSGEGAISSGPRTPIIIW
ncbi:hypothetical protein CsSME_00031957 [Camellia sinensis var. sinensis]